MKYFDLNTVVNSYLGFQNCMTNKSWGYLAILKGCNNIIQPSMPYEVNMDIVSNFLENTFNLSQPKRQYDNGRSLYVVFSNQWDKYFNDQGSYSPNIYDVAVWGYRRTGFPDNVTKEDIINMFSNEFNIPNSIISNSFNTENKDISFSDTLYSETDLKSELGKKGVNVSSDNIDARKGSVVASPGEISRGPFVQPLYAGLDISDYVLILQSSYTSLYGKGSSDNNSTKRLIPTQPLQQIFYGAPGTGKSYKIKEQTKGQDVIRTTFHPDSDYSTFVGCYKPTTKEIPMRDVTGKVIIENGNPVTENRIIYEFVNQAFMQAYIEAWIKFVANKEEIKKQFLVIEEINRGNCAQIFGDLFQLLDRNDQGFSEYPIKADADMKKQLIKQFAKIKREEIREGLDKKMVANVLDGDILLLPPNLYIWATMNTSDQSLFPIDSAFKRRWDWQYVPIANAYKNWKIQVYGKDYDWRDFLEKINALIGDTTNSEDKKLGYFFCKAKDGIITAEAFVSKVIFYLWNDVFKDFEFEGDLFIDEDKQTKLTFDKFYRTDSTGNPVVRENKIDVFLSNLGVKYADEEDDVVENVLEEADGETNFVVTTTNPANARDHSRYSINSQGSFNKRKLALECVKIYSSNHPEYTAKEIADVWLGLNLMLSGFIEMRDEHMAKAASVNDSQFEKRYYELTLPNNEIIFINNQFTVERINDFIKKVNAQDWGIQIEKVK